MMETTDGFRPLRAGVIAAGRGDRLAAPGRPLKPLVEIDGRPLIARVLDSLAASGAAEVVVIINDGSTLVRDRMERQTWPFALRWIVETTPSSMHSFLRVLETLADANDDGPFLVATVDTIAPPRAMARFVEHGRRLGADIVLALTAHVDDEKPLRVSLDGTRVTSFGGGPGVAPLVTAGWYLVRASVLEEAERARRDGLQALRAFLARLLDARRDVRGLLAGEAIDVDRPADIAAAEAFLKRETA